MTKALLALVFVVGVAGCNKVRVARAPARFKGPVEIEWSSDWEFRVKDQPRMRGTAIVSDGFFKVSLNDFPPGTAYEFGSDKGRVAEYGFAQATLDIRPRLKSLPADLEMAKIDPGTPFILKPEGGPPVIINLPPQKLSIEIDQLLKKAENGPLLFGDETGEKKGPPKSIMLASAHDHPVFGAARTLGDIDAFAFEHTLPAVKSTKKCGGYASGGKKMPDLTVQMKDVEVVVYDRRDGSVFKKNTFPPDPGCPMFVFTSNGENSVDASKDSKAIEAWLRSLVH
jgi:hypothetical protein